MANIQPRRRPRRRDFIEEIMDDSPSWRFAGSASHQSAFTVPALSRRVGAGRFDLI
jgi:hypothetical protein